MDDTLTRSAWSDSRIPASLWFVSIGSSLAAIPFLFFIDILFVGLGLLGLAVVLISLDDRYRMFILVALLPLSHAGVGLSDLGGFGPYDIFLAWFILLFLWRAGPLTLFRFELPRPIWLSGAMILAFIPSVINSGISPEAAKAFLQLFGSVLTAAGVYDILRRREDPAFIRKLLMFFAGVAALVSVYGLLQTAISGSLISVATGRAYFSFFQDVNYYSGYLLMALAVAIGLVLSSRAGLSRLLLLGCIVVLIIAVIATVSRSALVVFFLLMLAYVAYLVLQRGVQKWIGALLVGGVVAVMSLVVFTDLGKRMVDLLTLSRRIETVLVGQDASLQQRANILLVTARMIKSHPVAGVGFGSFEETFERYKETYLSTGFKRSAHNTYLRVAAETGIIGFSAFVVFLVSLLRTILQGIRLTRRTPFEVTFLSVAFSLGTFLLMSATLDQMFEPHFWVMVGIALAYGSVLKRLLGSNDIHRSDHAHA